MFDNRSIPFNIQFNNTTSKQLGLHIFFYYALVKWRQYACTFPLNGIFYVKYVLFANIILIESFIFNLGPSHFKN